VTRLVARESPLRLTVASVDLVNRSEAAWRFTHALSRIGYK
jgi:hypothetical protein